MPPTLALLPAAAPIVARHLGAYVELAAADGAVLARSLAQRLIAAAVALLGIFFTLLLSCVWLVSAVWATPWRGPTLAALILLFAALALAGSVIVVRRWRSATAPFARLRREWECDRRLVSDWETDRPDAAESASSPQERLQQTREELQLLLSGQDAQGENDVFPRSTTMRVLLGRGSKGIATTVAIAALTGFVPKGVRWLLRFVPVASLIQLLFQQRGPRSRTASPHHDFQ
jgi:hypothetical protein